MFVPLRDAAPCSFTERVIAVERLQNIRGGFDARTGEIDDG